MLKIEEKGEVNVFINKMFCVDILIEYEKESLFLFFINWFGLLVYSFI